MRTTLTITDVTRMQGDKVCVAGIDDYGNCVRPVARGEVRERHLYQGGRLIICPKAKVEFDLAPTRITPPHIEDKGFDPSTITGRGFCTDDEWERILRNSCFDSVEAIFDGHLENDRYVLPRSQTRSLGTIGSVQINHVEIDDYEGKHQFRLSFTDSTGKRYNRLPINDLTLRAYLQKSIATSGEMSAERAALQAVKSADRLYLRIGLARPWTREGFPEACWTQVTGTYTFPDHLEGKTLADFRGGRSRRVERTG